MDILDDWVACESITAPLAQLIVSLMSSREILVHTVRKNGRSFKRLLSVRQQGGSHRPSLKPAHRKSILLSHKLVEKDLKFSVPYPPNPIS